MFLPDPNPCASATPSSSPGEAAAFLAPWPPLRPRAGTSTWAALSLLFPLSRRSSPDVGGAAAASERGAAPRVRPAGGCPRPRTRVAGPRRWLPPRLPPALPPPGVSFAVHETLASSLPAAAAQVGGCIWRYVTILFPTSPHGSSGRSPLPCGHALAGV